MLKNDLKETRIGIVVGLKFSKKAVERNQMKRFLREIFRPELKNIKEGFDFVVVARKRDREKIKKEKIQEFVMDLLKRGELIKNKD